LADSKDRDGQGGSCIALALLEQDVENISQINISGACWNYNAEFQGESGFSLWL
jgi:hypothetical protein